MRSFFPQFYQRTQRFLKTHQHVTFLFVGISFLTLGLLTYWSLDSNSREPDSIATLTTLEKTVQTGGVQEFLLSKGKLKHELSQVLSHPESSEEEVQASNIALYLFPDILPDSHFEKNIALQLWAPLQEEIEKAPKTARSRMLFEQMKNEIWNYENPKQEPIGLSKEASQTLNIYYQLSAP